MLIGLTYTHISTKFWKILPNYLYLLESQYRPVHGTVHEALVPQIHKLLDDGLLEDKLLHRRYDKYFEAPVLRKILLEAYPYEILYKFLGEDITNDDARNERLISMFNDFFAIDYHETIQTYCDSCRSEEQFQRSLAHHELLYDDMAKAIKQFIVFVEALLRDQWFEEEAEECTKFLQTKVIFAHEKWMSGVTIDNGSDILIKVWNMSYTTLFHEMVHAVNNFFREKFAHADHHDVCFDQLTKTNEWLANFVAYHCYDAIMSGQIDQLEEMATDQRFFSSYMDVYATLYQSWSDDPAHNFQIVHDEMQKFEWSLFSKKKAAFYYERFYKYFHYNQHTYMYPKELMYHIWYTTIREMFAESSDKKQLLVQCLLGTVCL